MVEQTVLEIKHKLNGERLEFPCTACLLDPPRRAVLFYVSWKGWRHERPAIRIPVGALTFGYYWQDRSFNVYHWLDPAGSTIGYYFNAASHTTIHSQSVEWNDLELDYWLDAYGNAAFLDEEAVPVTLDPTLVALIADVKTHLVGHAPVIAGEVQAQTDVYLARVDALRGPRA